MAEVSLNTFPETYVQALALAWVKCQLTPELSPEDACRLYWGANSRIRAVSKEAREAAQSK